MTKLRVQSAKRGCRGFYLLSRENHKSKLRTQGKKYPDFTNKSKKYANHQSLLGFGRGISKFGSYHFKPKKNELGSYYVARAGLELIL